ncbi:MAG: AAA family ATPase [Methylococcales bacterium]|nr:AAA family ATPase [Methylococcales bacterium]
MSKKTKIITAWSLRGGSTRTTTLANLATALVEHDPTLKVAIIDADFSGAGILQCFSSVIDKISIKCPRGEAKDFNNTTESDANKLLSEIAFENQWPILLRTKSKEGVNIRWDKENCSRTLSVFPLPVSPLQLGILPGTSKERKKTLEALISQIAFKDEQGGYSEFDYIIIDTPSGVDSFLIVSLADIVLSIVDCARLQDLFGTPKAIHDWNSYEEIKVYDPFRTAIATDSFRNLIQNYFIQNHAIHIILKVRCCSQGNSAAEKRSQAREIYINNLISWNVVTTQLDHPPLFHSVPFSLTLAVGGEILVLLSEDDSVLDLCSNYLDLTKKVCDAQ